MGSWTQLGLAIGNRVHIGPKPTQKPKKKTSKSRPVPKAKPPMIQHIELDELNDSVDDLYV